MRRPERAAHVFAASAEAEPPPSHQAFRSGGLGARSRLVVPIAPGGEGDQGRGVCMDPASASAAFAGSWNSLASTFSCLNLLALCLALPRTASRSPTAIRGCGPSRTPSPRRPTSPFSASKQVATGPRRCARSWRRRAGRRGGPGCADDADTATSPYGSGQKSFAFDHLSPSATHTGLESGVGLVDLEAGVGADRAAPRGSRTGVGQLDSSSKMAATRRADLTARALRAFLESTIFRSGLRTRHSPNKQMMSARHRALISRSESPVDDRTTLLIKRHHPARATHRCQ